MAQRWERSPPTSSITARCYIWAEFVVGSQSPCLLLGFSSGFSGFPPSTKTNISEFQFDRLLDPHENQQKAAVASSLNIVIDLFIYLDYVNTGRSPLLFL